MISPTAMTTSRMTLRLSIEPKGPPVRIAYSSPTDEVPAWIGASAPPGRPERLRRSVLLRVPTYPVTAPVPDPGVRGGNFLGSRFDD